MNPAHLAARTAFRYLASATACVLLASGSAAHAAPGQTAILVSDYTYAYFTDTYEPSRCNVGDWNLGTQEYDRYYMGWEVVLQEVGLNYVVIRDEDVTALALQNFSVLILSNNLRLDASQTRAIAGWVRRGGHLLATFGSGYSDVNGNFFAGGTNALHELWGDPSAKVNSSFYLGNPWVKVQITQGTGPTQGLAPGSVLDYQYLANILIQRPASSRDVNAFFVFNELETRVPAVFNSRHSRGQVVYYAFAPEYLVALASNVAGHCEGDTRYSDQQWLDAIAQLASGLKPLMKSTLEYLQTP